MINYYHLKQMLLKAVSLGKNRQGLVLVQRVANGPTGTYLVHKWIRPDKVGATDRVLAGHVHLHSSHPQAPNNPKQYSNFSFAYSNAVKQQTAAFFNSLPNTQAFYTALHNLGITYTAHPTKPGITLMRAKGAMNAAIHNGLDLSALPPQVLGLNNPITLPAQPAAPTQQPVQQPTAAQPVTPPPVTPAAPPQPATAPANITLPPRAKVASQASKDAATQFCNSFATRQDFYDALTKMGITWTQTSKPGPTFMWAKCFLAQHIESGFDPVAAWAAIQNGTTQQSTQPQPAAQVPPPPPQPASPPPPVDKSLLEVPKDATPAQIELIKHINNMTDYKTIRKCAIMGMVPEDDVAADYITDTMLGRLKDWVNGSNHQNKCPASVAKRFIADMADIGENVKGATQLWSNNSERVVDSLGVTGCKKSLISDGLNRVFGSIDMAALITPHQFITPVGEFASSNSVSTLQMLSSLTSFFSDYTTDKQFDNNAGKTNLGYTGYNPDEYQQRYDVNKEGLVRFLQKVKQDNAGNAEVAAEVDRMIHNYDEAMKIVGGNAVLLNQLIQKDSWGEKQQYSTWNFGSQSAKRGYDPEIVQFTLKGANAQADALLSGLQSRGYSPDQIVDVINNFYYNDDLSNFKVRDSSGQRVYVDLYSDLTDPVTGTNPLSDYGPLMSKGVLKLALIKLQEQTGLSDADARAKGWYKDNELEQIRQWIKGAQHYATYTEADAKKVRDLISGIFEGHATNPSAAKTTIMANALMAVKFGRVAMIVANGANDNARSAQNANGRDYAGNFDFYSPNLLLDRATRETNHGNDWNNSATYTVQELSDKITSQLNSTPSYSAEYIQQLTQYYMDKAAQQGMAPTIDNAHTVAREDDLSDMDLSAGFDPLLDSPLKDVVYKTTVAMLSHVPKMKQDPKFQSKIDKKLNYLPYDFTASTQPRLKPLPKTLPKMNPQNLNATTDAEMKAARRKLFKAASMSVATESEQVSEQMRKDINQNRFDYKAGEKTPDGKTFSGPFHRTAAQDNRCVLYNSRFFAVHNSIWEERFNKKQAELKAAHPNDPDMWTPMDLFHGTARSCSGNILGRTAGWWMGKSTDYTAAGKMLGPGAYFGFKLGKSTVYAGDVPYSNISYHSGDAPPPGDADGVVIMANVMRGDNFTKRATTNESYTSVSTDGTRDWEMAVRDNALIFPHHFVDVSCRSYKKNVKVDANGNYLDDNGSITHDKYGKSVTMK